MKIKVLLEIAKGIKTLEKVVAGKATYAIAKNKRTIKGLVEPILETIKAMQEKYAERDADGKTIMEGHGIKMKDLAGFEKEYKEFIEKEEEIKIHYIKEEDLPKDLSVEQADAILYFVK